MSEVTKIGLDISLLPFEAMPVLYDFAVELTTWHAEITDNGEIINALAGTAFTPPVTPPEPPPISYTLPVLRHNPIPDSVGDISLVPDEIGLGDILFIPGDVSCDSGLQTAIYMSLFTDAPVEADGYETRGWWGDTIDEYGVLGSKLWTLTKDKMIPNISSVAKEYCIEALNWMIVEKVASEINVAVSRSGLYSLLIEVEITRPSNSVEYYKYAYNWAAQKLITY